MHPPERRYEARHRHPARASGEGRQALYRAKLWRPAASAEDVEGQEARFLAAFASIEARHPLGYARKPGTYRVWFEIVDKLGVKSTQSLVIVVIAPKA
jgi:hypothetical protein